MLHDNNVIYLHFSLFSPENTVTDTDTERERRPNTDTDMGTGTDVDVDTAANTTANMQRSTQGLQSFWKVLAFILALHGLV
jgi:hypothetical protein